MCYIKAIACMAMVLEKNESGDTHQVKKLEVYTDCDLGVRRYHEEEHEWSGVLGAWDADVCAPSGAGHSWRYQGGAIVAVNCEFRRHRALRDGGPSGQQSSAHASAPEMHTAAETHRFQDLVDAGLEAGQAARG